MKYFIILLLLAGCAPTAASQPVMDHSQHEAQQTHAGHEAPTKTEIAARTNTRIERLKAAELQYIGAMLAYESLPKLEALWLSARVEDSLDHLRTLKDAPPEDFLVAEYYYNYSIKELLDYVQEQKASK